MQSGIGPVILLNLGITLPSRDISIGGHLGGLSAARWPRSPWTGSRRCRRGSLMPVAACVVIAVGSAVAAIVVADRRRPRSRLAALSLVT